MAETVVMTTAIISIGGATVKLANLVLTQINFATTQKRLKQKPTMAMMEQDVIAIKDDLEVMQSFLMDLGSKQGESHMLKTYVRLVRDLGYDGEDCLQEFLLVLEQPPRASPKLLLTQDEIATMLKNLREKVNGIREKLRYCVDASGLDVQTGSGIGTPPVPPSRINSVAYGKAPLIGREMERSHLIKLISEQGEQCRVISIWGMLGIGKTALTKSVYQSQELSCMFEQGAWVSVMHPFNLEDVLTSLARQLNPRNSTVSAQANSKALGPRRLESEESMKPLILNGLRCIIVLDGVLSTEEWKLIKPYLLATNASRIVVTTTEATVAEHCSTAFKNIYKLQALDDDAALELFKSKVFMKASDFDLHPGIASEAKLIVKECDGHPLTIASIGELLSSKPMTAIEWKKFNDHFSAGFESTPSLQLIRTALSPTYDHLPYHLQLCLLYLSIFPKGHNIRRRRLVMRWIAEGYSCETQGNSAEETGESYFQELISRSIIRPSKTVPSSVKHTGCFQVNSLHHKISFSKAMEENHGFVLGNAYNSRDTGRHIVINSTDADRNNLHSMDMYHVRSLTVFGAWRSYFISSQMRLLRVLDLEGTSGLKDDDLTQIGIFLHLRYLSLRGCVDIYHLPDSVGNLWGLQMLDIKGTRITKLPNTITKLKMLQHIGAGNVPLNDGATSSSSSIPKKLQEAIGEERSALVERFLEKRKIAKTVQFSAAVLDFMIPSHTSGLDMHGVEVPEGIGNLNALQTLGFVNVSAGRAILTDLEKLTQLRKLGVTGINRKNSQKLLSAVGKLTLLINLSMGLEGKPGLHGCLDHIFSPPKQLQGLKLYGNLVTLPTWINQLQNLSKLKLQSTRLQYDLAMQVLEKLPHLSTLRLWMETFQDKKLAFHFQRDSFPSLAVLEMAYQDGIQSVTIDDGAMPNLELLQMKDCIHDGKGIFSGLSFLRKLKEVVRKGHYDANFMEHLRTELALNPNKPILTVA